MRQCLQFLRYLALCAALALLCARSSAAQQPLDAPESEDPAYTASGTFDLLPSVARASFRLRRPQVEALYNAIGKAYGIHFLFDREMAPSRVVSDFEMEDVSLQQALESAGNISRTFASPLDEHTAMVASDSGPKRGEYERQLMEQFRVDTQTTPQQVTEVSTALRTLLDLRRVAQDTRTNTISVLGRARQVAAARQFIGTVVKERGEVMVEIEILEVDSQSARSLGFIPPQPYQMLLVPGLVPFAGLRVVRTAYGVQLPGATATLDYSSSAVRSLQRLEVRAGDGQQAGLLIGERFPILQGYVSGGYTGTTTTGTASSAFAGSFPAIQYEDVGVTVKATPYMHSGRELTLKLDLAMRSVTGDTFNGAPILSQRQVTEQFRMRDGETYLIGGILNHSESHSVSGYPVLGKLPLIGALFGSHKKQEAQTEILLLVRPRVLRSSSAEVYASNSIFFGRELQGLPAAPPPPPEPQPGQPIPGAPPGVVPQPGVAPQPGVQQQPFVQPGQNVPFIPGLPPGVQQQVPQQNQPFIPGFPPGIQSPPGQPGQQPQPFVYPGAPGQPPQQQQQPPQQ